MSIWDDPVTALGHVYNVITNDELKGYRPFLPTSLSVDIFISRCRYVFCSSIISFGFVCMTGCA